MLAKVSALNVLNLKEDPTNFHGYTSRIHVQDYRWGDYFFHT